MQCISQEVPKRISNKNNKKDRPQNNYIQKQMTLIQMLTEKYNYNKEEEKMNIK